MRNITNELTIEELGRLCGPIVTNVGCKTCRETGRELYLKKGKTKERVCQDCKGSGKFTIPAVPNAKLYTV